MLGRLGQFGDLWGLMSESIRHVDLKEWWKNNCEHGLSTTPLEEYCNASIPNTEFTSKVPEFDTLLFEKSENFQDHSPQ